MLLLVAITVFFAGCSKDDDEIQNTNPLIGVWECLIPFGDVVDIFTYTFNSNGTFHLSIVYGFSGVETTARGTYNIYDKDKVIFHITYYFGEPNADIYNIKPFRIDRDSIGEYLWLSGEIGDKFYKK